MKTSSKYPNLSFPSVTVGFLSLCGVAASALEGQGPSESSALLGAVRKGTTVPLSLVRSASLKEPLIFHTYGVTNMNLIFYLTLKLSTHTVSIQ